jgi:hypothetical protein
VVALPQATTVVDMILPSRDCAGRALLYPLAEPSIAGENMRMQQAEDVPEPAAPLEEEQHGG